MSVHPYDLTTHDGKTVDWLTHAALLECERRLGYPLTIVQGSYHKGVSASAGTHDGGGVVDLAPWDWQNKVRVLRAVGFAVWHRPTLPGVWNEHIHAVLIGNAKLAPSAARQVTAYRNGRNGLANNGPDDFKRPNPIPVFKWTPPVIVPEPAPVVMPKRKATTLHAVDWNVRKQRKPAAVTADLEHLIAAEKPDVLTLQEVAGYRAVLDGLDGYHVAAFADDCAVLVRDGHDIKAGCEVRVTTRGWFTVTGKRTGPKSAAACIVDGVGFASVHTPPTVQSRAKRLAAPRRWAAYRELMRSMPGLVAHLGPRAVVAMDSNVDASSDKGMAGWPLATFRALGMDRHAPKSGTHGSRAIDYVFAKGVTVTTPRVVVGRFGSDHKPISYSVTY